MLLAIDPGITTGIAMRLDDGTIQTCVTRDPMEVLSFCTNANQVVIERFITSGRLAPFMLETIELVGMVRGYCASLRVAVKTQTPGQREGEKLKANKILVEIGADFMVHEIDALAHLLTYERNMRIKVDV